MKIEVWSDFVCPFCYIGKRRLEAALEEFPHRNRISVEYKSYELDPNAEKNPSENMYELLANKYQTSVEEAKESTDNIVKQAAGVGLTYNFDKMQRTNTFDAHRVAKYAAKQEKGNEMAERLLKAYFTDSEHIGDHQTLIKLAGEIGLDIEEVEDLLQSVKYKKDVRFDEEQAQQIGVQGVPFFVFNEKYAVSGAQAPETFRQVLEKVWEEEKEQPPLKNISPKNSETTYCTDEGCKGSEGN